MDPGAVERLRRLAEEPDLTGTRYRVLDLLGRGGMGVAWLAHDEVLQREVALKVVADGASAEGAAGRMLREARILARLEHPGIVPVHDAGILPDGRAFYVMKRVRGRPLSTLRPANLPLAERLRLFERLCESVAFAHARGVVHRDLKPSNVMIGDFGEVLVLDWGVAKALDQAEAAEAAPSPAAAELDATAPGSVVGTPGWMSPEQAAGTPVDARADVWSLGALLHLLLVGRPPADPPDPREHDRSLPRPLASIVLCALARDAAARYPDAEVPRRDVVRFLDGEPVTAHRESLPERTLRVARRHRLAITLALAYVIMRTALLILWRR